MRALAFSRKRRQILYGVAGGFGCLLIPTGGITQASKSEDEPPEGYVSARSCGAKDDGVADDTQPILDALRKDREGKFFFPGGEYIVSNPVEIEHFSAAAPKVSYVRRSATGIQEIGPHGVRRDDR